jgi:hypothetical protein
MFGALREAACSASRDLAAAPSSRTCRARFSAVLNTTPSDNERLTGESLGFRYIFPAHVGAILPGLLGASMPGWTNPCGCVGAGLAIWVHPARLPDATPDSQMRLAYCALTVAVRFGLVQI